MLRRIALVMCMTGLTVMAASADGAQELNVLPRGADKILYEFLLEQSKRLYAQRAADVETALQSPHAARRRGERLLRDYRRIIGELPREKTPLNAKVTGVIEFEGYRVEKVVFESRPDHHVTAALYIPTTGKGPFPAVAVPCGHSANGKGYDRAPLGSRAPLGGRLWGQSLNSD